MRSLPSPRALAVEPKPDQFVVMHDLRRDEAALEVGMDHPGRRGSLVSDAWMVQARVSFSPVVR